jgi:hypothetical protein
VDLGTQATFTKSVSDAVVDLLADELKKKHSIEIHDKDFVKNVYYLDLINFDTTSGPALTK